MKGLGIKEIFVLPWLLYSSFTVETERQLEGKIGSIPLLPVEGATSVKCHPGSISGMVWLSRLPLLACWGHFS